MQVKTFGSSPWGSIQHINVIARGIAEVSTSGHGGIRISKALAESKLSPGALKRAIVQGGYYWYEEDCLYSIPVWELEVVCKTPERRQSALHSLSMYNADYLLERGEVPLPEPYAAWRLIKEEDKMRRERDPDLIVSAVGADDCVKVWTADRIEHRVTKESYAGRSGLNLLSKCILFV